MTHPLSFPPVDSERPELSGLERDLLAFLPLWGESEAALQAAVDKGTNGREALTNVTQDYYVRAYEHGVGTALLLREYLKRTPARKLAITA